MEPEKPKILRETPEEQKRAARPDWHYEIAKKDHQRNVESYRKRTEAIDTLTAIMNRTADDADVAAERGWPMSAADLAEVKADMANIIAEFAKAEASAAEYFHWKNTEEEPGHEMSGTEAHERYRDAVDTALAEAKSKLNAIREKHELPPV